mgnify:FL=1
MQGAEEGFGEGGIVHGVGCRDQVDVPRITAVLVVVVFTRRRPSPRVAVKREPIECSSADPTSTSTAAVGVLSHVLSEHAVSDGVDVGREGVVAEVGKCESDESGAGTEVDGSLVVGDAVLVSRVGEEVVEVDAEDLSS